MKNTTHTISSIAFALCLLVSCQSADKKEEAAENKVEDAKENLEEVRSEIKADAVKTANDEEWTAFKKESEEKIQSNEDRIADLKKKMKKSGKVLDGMYAQKIESLEIKNAEMRNRIANEEKSHSDWESFKREYNHDMDELGKSLKDISVDNKN